MKIRNLHSWNVSCAEAIRLQYKLRSKLILKDGFRVIRRVAGCDIALDQETRRAFAGVIVYAWPGLEEIERKYSVQKVTFPYVPGLLAFREAPALLNVIASLTHDPDLFIFDGQGIAHPRGMGIASHLGLFLDKPTIGCAKSRLCGSHEEPLKDKGVYAPLLAKDKSVIGAVLRTRRAVNPVFISPGHKISLKTAIAIILQATDGYRIPKPTREADHYVEAVKREKRGTPHG
ncbi:MAG: deoxyribonuclease V [Candidatus Omnitrophica bacterium]|nr:deoxyribonuclease V [Candidatus Omnitrophota bacterium]MDD5671987.1 deoxyribonuclease V [Candidatus Omnitrophota bacterium]